MAWILGDDECGQFALVPTSGIEQAVAKHFFFQHQRTGTLTEHRDFWIISPPPRCDLCGTVAEKPWWEHTCSPPLAEVDDLDGAWLTCDACHALVLQGDADALTERVWEITKVTSPGLTNGPLANLMKARMRELQGEVLKRFDAGRREGIAGRP